MRRFRLRKPRGRLGVANLVILAFLVTSTTPSSAATAPPLVKSAHHDLVQTNDARGSLALAPTRGTLQAQPRGSTTSSTTSSVNWSPLGPGGGNGTAGVINSGRVTGLAISPGASPTIYLASAGGGVWSSTNAGASWTTNTDTQPSLAIGSITVDSSNPSVLFAGAGESNQCSDCHTGDGILESLDGGTTWTTSNPGGIFTDTYTSAVVVEPGASSLASTTVLIGNSNNLYVSHDGGTSWSPERGTGWIAGSVQSVVLNSLTSPASIYAWVQGAGLEMSTDNGASWTTTQNAAASDTSAKGALAIAPNAALGSTVLYLSLGGGSQYVGMYKSTDGGVTWTQLSNCTLSSTNCVPYFTSSNYGYNGLNDDSTGDQGYFDNVVAVDPLNPNIVIAGGVTAVESLDGGRNWIDLDANSGFANFHPDIHALTFDSAGNLYLGTDGGLWGISATNLASETLRFNDLNSNLNTTQFYAGIGQLSNGGEILAGSQDNGTFEYLASSPASRAWTAVDSGDGGVVAIDPSNPNFQISESDVSSTQGALDATTNNWVTVNPLTLPPYGTTDWVSPVLIVPNASGSTIVFGGDGVYESGDGGATWDAPTGYTSSTVSSLAVAPSNPSVLYAGFDDGTIQMSNDGGATWVTIDTLSSANVVWHIAVSATDPYTVYVAGASGSSAFTQHGAPQLLVGTNLNTTPAWTSINGDLPSNDLTSAVIADGHGGLIAANDIGVYWASVLNGQNTRWQRLGAGLPNVQIQDILLTPNDTLIAATHGRGLWTLAFSKALNPSLSVCTWTGGSGASGSDWSVGANWTTTSGASCTGPGGPPSGAQVIFPAASLNTSVTWDSGSESGGGGAPSTSFDSLTIENSSYRFTNANTPTSLTLTPTASTLLCGASTNVALCASYPSGSLTLPLSLIFKKSVEVATSNAGSTLVISGTISDAQGTFTIGDATNQGVVTLSALNANLSAPTNVQGGALMVTGSLASSTVTVSSAATLEGSGTVGSIMNDAGSIAPGESPSVPGTLTSLGDVQLQSTGSGDFVATLAGDTAGSGYSQLSVAGGTVNLGDATLTLHLASASLGGSVFTIVSLASGATATGTFLGLANSQSLIVNGVTFVVTYPSQNGGDPTQGAVLTALGPPAAPSAPQATSTNAAATVTWHAPSSNGGEALMNYTVTASDATSPANGGETCVWTSGPLTCSFSGLTNGDTYTFRVTAANALGTSGASPSSNAVVPMAKRPGPVSIQFGVRSSVLSAGARQSLQRLARSLVNGAVLSVTGFAHANAKLARSRALAVTHYLQGLLRVRIVVAVGTSWSQNEVVVVTTKV